MPPEAAMRSLEFGRLRLTDPFWTERQQKLREATLPAEYEQIVSTGRLGNFLRAAARQEKGFQGRIFNDSDVYKWCEACAYALALGPDENLQRQLDEATQAIRSAQEADGYLNTYFQLEKPDLKWRNLGSMHEMYCGGHLIEAGVALAECLGDRRLLEVSVRFADHLIDRFGPQKRKGYCGHQEIELALLKLARHTGNRGYAELARWMVETRGSRPSPFEAELDDEEAMKLSPFARGMLTKDGVYSGEYLQDHLPIREQTDVVGHAVRAMYFYIAAAELAAEAGDEVLKESLLQTWTNLTQRRMYLTGGIGPSASNEGFTTDYDLPNLSAYAETCAAIGLVMWGNALLQAFGEGDLVEVMEQALYNGVMSGISLSGDRFFYTNPLESRDTDERTAWFDCACCPPNIARLIGSVGRYAAGLSSGEFFVNIPIGMVAEVAFDGVPVRIEIESNYPWSGEFRIRVDPERPVSFALRVRLPDWAGDVSTELPGLEAPSEFEKGYAVFRKRWEAGDVLTVDLGMVPRWLEAHPKVLDNLGRVALARGPVVYCIEGPDNDFVPQTFSADSEALVEEVRGRSPGGGIALKVAGAREKGLFDDALYAEAGTTQLEPAEATFIPYHAWSNRGRSHMQVWVRRL